MVVFYVKLQPKWTNSAEITKKLLIISIDFYCFPEFLKISYEEPYGNLQQSMLGFS